MKIKCPYCGCEAVLTDSIDVYGGRSYGMIWLCRPCDAYIGTHKNSKTHVPIGRLANAELRKWKVKAHAVFDPLWKTGKMTRKQAYSKMREVLKMTHAQAHIGKFGIEECKRLVNTFDGKEE